MSSTQAAGFGVFDSLSSFSMRRCDRAAVSCSRAWRILRENVEGRIVGDVDDGLAERGQPQSREQAHIVFGQVVIKHGRLPSHPRSSPA